MISIDKQVRNIFSTYNIANVCSEIPATSSLAYTIDNLTHLVIHGMYTWIANGTQLVKIIKSKIDTHASVFITRALYC